VNGIQAVRYRYSLLIAVIALLAGCGAPNNGTGIPTAFQLPTLTPSAAAISLRPTLPPVWSATPTPTTTSTETPSLTPTVTPSTTITDTPTPTDSATPLPTADNGAVLSLLSIALKTTVLPPNFLPNIAAASPVPNTGGIAISCSYLPGGGFGAVLTTNPALVGQIGCPTQPSVIATSGVSQIFERGVMVWLQGAPSLIYVLQADGTFLRFDDTYNSSVDPINGGEVPPAGLIEPVRGFGKVWRTYANVRANLGWAISGETQEPATVQPFERGRMVYLPHRGDVIVLTEDAGGASGRWQSIPGKF
jgi:hypothetical protein